MLPNLYRFWPRRYPTKAIPRGKDCERRKEIGGLYQDDPGMQGYRWLLREQTHLDLK